MTNPRLLLLATLCAFGCSDGGTPSDASVELDMTAGPDLSIAHTPAPVVSSHGGPVLAAVEVWTVVWPGDEATGARLDAFHGALVQSDYWKVLMEYGVGAGSAKGVIAMTSPPPANFTDAGLDNIVSSVAMQLGAQWNASSMLVVLIPATSTVDGGLDAFHAATFLGGYPYAMVTQHNARHRADPFDDLTFISSHEIAEAATDPTVAGWYANGFDEIAEVADLCSEETTRIPATVELGDASVSADYLVVRQYSEQAAIKESVNPCVPTPAGEPYFNGAIAPMIVTVDGQGAETGMGTLQLFSYSGDVGALSWSVDVPYDRSNFTVSPNHGSNNAGESVAIKVTSMGAIHEAHAGRIIVNDANGIVNEWWFPITVQ